MKASELILKLAEVVNTHGDVPVSVINSGYYEGDELNTWQVAEINEVRVDGMEIELWV